MVWVLESDEALMTCVTQRPAERKQGVSPAMAIDHALADPVGFSCYAATTPEAQAVCAEVTESGYDMPGLAWLMAEQGNIDAPDVVWPS